MAVAKAVKQLKLVVKNVMPSLPSELGDFRIVKTNGKIYKLHRDEILFAEAKLEIITKINCLKP